MQTVTPIQQKIKNKKHLKISIQRVYMNILMPYMYKLIINNNPCNINVFTNTSLGCSGQSFPNLPSAQIEI